jgi:acyl-coenzyme A synthetase/AMP-(fatty) acid ligase
LLRQGCSAAFSFDLDGKDRLGIVAEIERRGHVIAESNHRKNGLTIDDDWLLKDIRRVVAEEHDLQVHSIALIKAGTIPKTSSGKIQRQSCRAAFLANTLETICRS